MSTIEKAMAKLKSGTASTDEKHSPAELLQEEVSEEAPERMITESAERSEFENVKTPPSISDFEDEVVDSESGSVESEQFTKASEKIVAKAASQESDISNSDHQTSEQVFVEIDTIYLKNKGFITQNSDNRIMKEQFRSIKRKLLNNAFGPISSTLHYPNLIIITSCNPHEGKTFSSINLALNIALEQDKTVLLVDSDVVRPSVTRELGVKLDTGLTEYLSGSIANVSDIIYNTNIDNFKFIPAGKPHELSSELLASEKMHKLTKELATRYSDRVVIFDAPPLLGVNETHVMANLVGQAVVVVEENKTKLTDIENAVSQLDKKLAIGFLVNKSRGSYRDYYGYGYYYNRDKK